MTLTHLIPALLLAPGVLCGAPPEVGGWERIHLQAPGLSGAVLAGELACTACHATGRETLAPKPGPDLAQVGARAHGAHLERFIAAPSAVKPGTTMPDVLSRLPESTRAETARALAHYLATLGKLPAYSPPGAEAAERGKQLYHEVGCVACHSPEAELAGSIPLGPLAEKYTVAGLAAFLQDPLGARPGGRMPDLHLEDQEAEDIASYLLRGQNPLPAFVPDDALAARGKNLFTEHRCDACHATGEPRTAPTLTAWNKLRPEHGCLSGQPGPWPWPYYPLTETQHSALRTAIAEEARVWTAEEKVAHALTRLNCIACHQRGELGGVVTARNAYFTGKEDSLGEQGRLPPTLTGVGAKLKAGWLHEVVANGAGARPSVRTRMPKFGAANTESLAGWFKELDTLNPPAPAFTRLTREEKPHQIGRDLTGTKGLNCIACHTFRGKASALHAPELTTMADRLEENWFHAFLAQPQRFAALTVMPNFWPDGKSPLPDVLGGDSGKQRDALWQFLSQGPEAGTPAGLVLEPLVLEVKDEAVLVRRAFPGIGKRGIGVGYPGGINLAFDAGQMRLATVWTGGFIEASGLWRGQGSGQANIQGKDQVKFPAGPALAVLENPDAPWPAEPGAGTSFRGYTLDDQRRPTFRYTTAGVTVEDRFREQRDASGALFLLRELTFSSPLPDGLVFRAAADKRIEPAGADTHRVGDGLRLRVEGETRMRTAEVGNELLVPVRGTLKLHYQMEVKP